MRICDAAIEVLCESDNDAVMQGDATLLHRIAERAGMAHEGWRTEGRVLDALSLTPGWLVRGKTRRGDNRLVRVFRLPA